ncbi:MAG TPA: CDP-alcohol phosphatidyltransferase family protein [Kofleriaceae bacterium]
MSVVFFEATNDRHGTMVSGVSALERRVREVAKQGATKAIMAGTVIPLPRPLPIPVEFVAPGSAAPTDAQTERADVIAGTELVDDDARKRAEWTLIRTMNKSWQGPVDALINWRFSMRITRFISRGPLAITPNQITVLSIICALIGAAFATGRCGLHGWLAFALGGVMMEVQSILDSVDGELARLRFQYSKFGQWLDNVSDDIVDNAFVAAVGIGLGGHWQTLGFIVAGVRLFVALVQFVSVYRSTGTGDVYSFRWFFETGAATSNDVYDPKKISTWLRSLGRRDTYLFIWMLACLAGFPYWVLGHAAIITSVYFVLVVLHFVIFRKRHM